MLGLPSRLSLVCRKMRSWSWFAWMKSRFEGLLKCLSVAEEMVVGTALELDELDDTRLEDVDFVDEERTLDIVEVVEDGV